MEPQWVLVALVSIALLVGLTAMLSSLHASAQRLIDAKVRNVTLATALTHANDVVYALVSEANQMVVDNLKAELAAKTISRETYLTALRRVKGEVCTNAARLVGDQLQAALGVDQQTTAQFLATKVEAAVAASKSPLAPSPRS